MILWGADTETFLFQPGLPTPKMVCGSWADEEREYIGTPEQFIKWFQESLERGDHHVGVNYAFDVVGVAAERPDLLPLIFQAGEAGLFHCCAVREALHDIAIDKLFIDYKTGKSFSKDDLGGRYSMVILMERHFGIDITPEKEGDVWRFKYASLYGKPIETWPQAAIDYPKQDARRPRNICVKQKSHRNKHDEPNQVRAAIAIQLMRTWGFRTDAAYIAHLEGEVDALWTSAREEFARAGIYRPNGTQDKKRLQALVSAAYNGDPPKTPKGQVATDRDTLAESGDPILEKLGTAGKNDKRKTVYLPALKTGIDVPVTPEFNVLVNTGRVSSDWQQMPQKGGIREGVVTRPGTVLGSLDYGGLELRTMSERALLEVGFSKMADYLNSGRDAHSYVGGFFLGLSYEEFLPRKVELKAYRDVAKMFNFGAGGGAGGFAIAYNAKVKDNIRLCLALKRAEKCGTRKVVGFVNGKEKRVCALCVDIAKELKEKWLSAWPEQSLLFEKASRLTNGRRKVDSVIFSNKLVRGGCGYTQWLNTPFQGAGGDGMKRAMWRIAREQYTDPRSPLWGSHNVLQIHDELWIESPEGQAHEALFRAAQIMVDTMNEITPHVRNEVVPAAMRRVFKAAADTYDRNGRLKAWWPTNCKGHKHQHSPECAAWNWKPDRAQMCADLAA